MTASTPISTEGGSRSPHIWAFHLAALGFLIVLILGLFWSDVAAAVEVWWIYPAYSHCFLIIPISAWLIWEKRALLRASLPELAPKALWAIPPIALAWLIGEFSSITELRQFAIVGLIQVAIFTMLGAKLYRLILFPALFLFFLVPTGQYLIPPLQTFTTHFVDLSLTLLNVPHYTEGTVIELANGRFEIAEACAGLRFLMATVALGAIFSYLMFRNWKKIAIFMIACVIVPIIGNGFRALGIILLAHITNNELAVGADHIVYGWGFSVLILLVLFLIGMRFRDVMTEEGMVAPMQATPSTRLAILITAACAALAIAIAPAFAWWQESRSITLDISAFSRPLTAEGWIRVPINESWRPAFNHPDAELVASFVERSAPSGPTVDVVIEYFGRMRGQHKLIASINSPWDVKIWHEIRSRKFIGALGMTPIDLEEATIGTGSQERLVWWSYWVDQRFTTSAFKAKLLELAEALKGQNEGALVAFSTPITGPVEEARQRLGQAMNAFDNIPTRLDQAAERPTGQGQD